MIVAGLFCVGFAAFDEYHQSFVRGRGPSKRDVAIDSIGIFIGIVLVLPTEIPSLSAISLIVAILISFP